MRFNRRVREVLEQTGFTLKPWPRNNQMGADNLMFSRGSMSGLIGCSDRFLQIIAIDNTEPGNGQFKEAMDLFEAAARKRHLGVEVAAIMNERLYRHLILKRGYKPHPSDGRHLCIFPEKYIPQPVHRKKSVT